MTWFTPLGASQDKLDRVVAHFRLLMTPKPGRCAKKAIKEIERQRLEKLDKIEKLRLEAAALFIVGRDLSESQKIPTALR